MFETFYPILFLFVFAVFLAVLLTVFSVILGRRTRSGKKGQSYECGVEPVGTNKEPIPVKYFLIGISFILFDIELIFLLPWAVVSRELGMFGFISIAVFIALVIIGYIYELGKGALKWE
ncbi:MAG: NADH-quinone oxidoreductase subunit A [candidate division Zixibacteria bacterium]|nr:NADH-quinone oxidoreductase subunit A [candidate division Zixibacteria bacterium]MDD5426758.1 NADH-quinone oxidoreductase subunit A [candidate division Zixibacteria bacterium]